MGLRELYLFFKTHTYLYTPQHAAEILSGSRYPHTGLPAPPHRAGAGALSSWNTMEIEEAIYALIGTGCLQRPRRGLRRGLVGIQERSIRMHFPSLTSQIYRRSVSLQRKKGASLRNAPDR